jgi:Uncharacterized protein conserved in bacteria (DUF2330)/HEAT repeats
MFATASTYGDGCFVFRWNKEKDINEPTQKAIILHDQNREDLVLQVKYEGPAEDFGWLIPVPGQPEVRKGSMEPFYELSKLTQERFRDGTTHNGMATRYGGEQPEVKVIEVKTVGAYEVAILSSTNPSALADWLAAHQFGFPKEKQGVLDQYIQRHWFFVAARINPEGDGFVVKATGAQPSKISGVTRQTLASGELHPIIISFPSEKCVFPLAISSVNGKPSEISLYVLSAEPLASSIVCDRKLKVYESEKEKAVQRHKEFKKSRTNWRASIVRGSPMETRMKAEDPNDPPPDSVFDRPGLGAAAAELYEDAEEDFYDPRLQLVRSMSVDGDTNAVKMCGRNLPRMKGREWWLTKVVETFAPEEMVDLEFEPAIPLLAERMRRENGEAAAHCLPQFGSLAVPTVLNALADSDSAVRRRALPAVSEMSDPQFVEPLLKLMKDKDAKIRIRVCYASYNNWNDRFVNPLLRLIRDPEPGVASAAQYCLRNHMRDINVDPTILQQMLAEDGPPSMFAVQMMGTHGRELPREQLVRCLSYTNLPTVSMAFNYLRKDITLDEVTPLMTNSLPIARMIALGSLARIGDKAAVERMVSMLHDPNEAIRWRVRSDLRRATGQKLGADPDAYEKWWAENKETFTPRPTSFGRR